MKKATFAGGCFWCMEPAFRNVEGIIDVTVGYSGGQKPDPKYEEVSQGNTGHYEAVQVTYDPDRISYENVLERFWQSIDLTDAKGQFADKGPQYRTAIFYHDDGQRRIAEKSKEDLSKSGKYGKPIATEIRQFANFYKAEECHQKYFLKSPIQYSLYKIGSGREAYIKKMDDKGNAQKTDDLKSRLTEDQYNVTQKCGTEPPFNNKYWDNKEEGIYVDVVSGDPLFSSKDKFDSGTGWPSFSRPLESGNVKQKLDFSMILPRTEVRSSNADSHLGHLFSDGPKPTGQRYCINSASLRFIPKKDMEKEGYGRYLEQFR